MAAHLVHAFLAANLPLGYEWHEYTDEHPVPVVGARAWQAGGNYYMALLSQEQQSLSDGETRTVLYLRIGTWDGLDSRGLIVHDRDSNSNGLHITDPNGPLPL